MNAKTEIHFLEALETNFESDLDTLTVLAERGPEDQRPFYTAQLTAARRLRKRNLKRLEHLHGTTHHP